MFCTTRDGCIVLPTTVPAVLANSLLRCFVLRDEREDDHIQQCVSEPVQSCNASKQLLQGEKQQQFCVRENFVTFCVLLFYKLYRFLPIPYDFFYLTLPFPIIIS